MESEKDNIKNIYILDKAFQFASAIIEFSEQLEELKN
jgi:hypothetical protein